MWSVLSHNGGVVLMGVFMAAGAATGVYYGRKFGGNFLKGQYFQGRTWGLKMLIIKGRI